MEEDHISELRLRSDLQPAQRERRGTGQCVDKLSCYPELGVHTGNFFYEKEKNSGVFSLGMWWGKKQQII